jgi:hypothetical protein
MLGRAHRLPDSPTIDALSVPSMAIDSQAYLLPSTSAESAPKKLEYDQLDGNSNQITGTSSTWIRRAKENCLMANGNIDFINLIHELVCPSQYAISTILPQYSAFLQRTKTLFFGSRLKAKPLEESGEAFVLEHHFHSSTMYPLSSHNQPFEHNISSPISILFSYHTIPLLPYLTKCSFRPSTLSSTHQDRQQQCARGSSSATRAGTLVTLCTSGVPTARGARRPSIRRRGESQYAKRVRDIFRGRGNECELLDVAELAVEAVVM